tara:strand:+ start:676 stop:1002 length:327 start_codon:yes stop_codon:yes gene_type:complete
MKMQTTINVVKVSAGTISDSGTDFSSIYHVDTDQFQDTDSSVGFNVAKMSVVNPSDVTKPNLALAKEISALRRADKKALFVSVNVEIQMLVGSKDTKPVIVGLVSKSK